MPQTNTVYWFEELSEDAKSKVLDKFYDINVRHDWWDHIFDGAKEIGLKIEEFDLNKGTIRGKLTISILDSISEVRKKYGKESGIYKTAKTYHKEYVKAFKKFYFKNKNLEEYEGWAALDFLQEFTYEEYGENEGITGEYEHSILEDYRLILGREYDFLTSEGMVVETIKADEYLFRDDGALV